MATKKCTKCKQKLDTSEFRKRSAARDGLNSWCKSCSANAKKKWQEDNQDKIKEYRRKYYIKNKKKLNEAGREYRKRNKKKLNEVSRKHRKKNKKKLRLYQRKYYAKVQGKSINYKYERKEKAIKYPNLTKENQLEVTRKYIAVNNGVDICDFNAVDVLDRLSVIGDTCIYCDAPREHIDHFFPLSANGPHAIANLFPSCANCNRQKRDANPWQWMKENNITPRLSWMAKKLEEIQPAATRPATNRNIQKE